MRKQREFQLHGGSKHEKMEDGRRRGTVTRVFYRHSTQATGTFITCTESIITYTLMYKHTHTQIWVVIHLSAPIRAWMFPAFQIYPNRHLSLCINITCGNHLLYPRKNTITLLSTQFYIFGYIITFLSTQKNEPGYQERVTHQYSEVNWHAWLTLIDINHLSFLLTVLEQPLRIPTPMMKWWPACVYGICALIVWWSAEQQY